MNRKMSRSMSAKMKIHVAVCPPRSSKLIVFISPDFLKQNEPTNEPKHEIPRGGVPATVVKIMFFNFARLFKAKLAEK